MGMACYHGNREGRYAALRQGSLSGTPAAFVNPGGRVYTPRERHRHEHSIDTCSRTQRPLPVRLRPEVQALPPGRGRGEGPPGPGGGRRGGGARAGRGDGGRGIRKRSTQGGAASEPAAARGSALEAAGKQRASRAPQEHAPQGGRGRLEPVVKTGDRGWCEETPRGFPPPPRRSDPRKTPSGRTDSRSAARLPKNDILESWRGTPGNGRIGGATLHVPAGTSTSRSFGGC
jgi:hypothetical protein